MATFNWTCPHCQYPQTATDHNSQSFSWKFNVGDADFAVGNGVIGKVATRQHATVCLNSQCRKLTFGVSLFRQRQDSNGNWILEDRSVKSWALIPESSAIPQPDYIPDALRKDYLEACRIRDLSPKSSATLARRCLQGMIRDFCKITKNTLNEEIVALEKLVAEEKAPRGVTPESVEAIDHVRKIGNIGAHMEKDINLIVDIEPDEAQILIELVETLFQEWYVAREARAKRFENLAKLRAEKEAVRTEGK